MSRSPKFVPQPVRAAWWWLSEPSRRYPFFTVALGITGFALILVGSTRLVWGDPEYALRSLARSLGEGLLIAFFLSVLVDPYIKKRLFKDVGHDAFWALFSDESPREFRESLQQLASIKRYYKSCVWTLRFDWDSPDTAVLRLEMRVHSTGVNLAERYRPEGRLWLLASIEGKESSVDSWHFESHGHPEIELAKHNLVAPILTVGAEGTVFVDEGRIPIPEDTVVRAKGGYSISRTITAYRSANDAIPLLSSITALGQTIRIQGGALSDLVFHGFHQDEEWTPEPRATDLEWNLNRTAFPGQTSVISWKRRAGSDGATS